MCEQCYVVFYCQIFFRSEVSHFVSKKKNYDVYRRSTKHSKMEKWHEATGSTGKSEAFSYSTFVPPDDDDDDDYNA